MVEVAVRNRTYISLSTGRSDSAYRLLATSQGHSQWRGDQHLYAIGQSLGTVRGATEMSIGTILLIILVIALLGGFTGVGGGPFYGTGYYGGGGLGLVIIILLILLVLGKI